MVDFFLTCSCKGDVPAEEGRRLKERRRSCRTSRGEGGMGREQDQTKKTYIKKKKQPPPPPTPTPPPDTQVAGSLLLCRWCWRSRKNTSFVDPLKGRRAANRRSRIPPPPQLGQGIASTRSTAPTPMGLGLNSAGTLSATRPRLSSDLTERHRAFNAAPPGLGDCVADFRASLRDALDRLFATAGLRNAGRDEGLHRVRRHRHLRRVSTATATRRTGSDVLAGATGLVCPGLTSSDTRTHATCLGSSPRASSAAS